MRRLHRPIRRTPEPGGYAAVAVSWARVVRLRDRLAYLRHWRRCAPRGRRP